LENTLLEYEPPIDDDGNEYYVPVVIKNRDTLVGYINGQEEFKQSMEMAFEFMGTNISLGEKYFDYGLDSSRFNDIMPDGRRESDLSDDEFADYLQSMENEHVAVMESAPSKYDYSLLKVECTCGFGFYSWEDFDSIPTETFKCHECGKVLIHYTGIDDYKYESLNDFYEEDEDDNEED